MIDIITSIGRLSPISLTIDLRRSKSSLIDSRIIVAASSRALCSDYGCSSKTRLVFRLLPDLSVEVYGHVAQLIILFKDFHNAHISIYALLADLLNSLQLPDTYGGLR